jgi:hypothetical protein
LVSSTFSAPCTKGRRGTPGNLVLHRVDLDQAVEEVAAVVERGHPEAFVEAVDAVPVGIAEHAADAVGRYAGRREERAVGGAGGHAGFI